MSLCIRTIPNKLTPFVNTRNHVRKIDCRRLPKDVSSSAFLEKFLGAQAARNCTSRMTRSRVASSFNQNVHRMAFNNKYRNGSRALLIKNLVEEDNDTYNRLWQYDMAHSHRLNVNESLVIPETISGINMCYGNNNSRDNNCINTYANESLKSNNSVAINGIHPCNGELQLNVKKLSILLSTKSPKDLPTADQVQDVTNDDKKVTPEQLEIVFGKLRRDLPRFFFRTMDYTIYDMNIVFINNIKGVETVGLFPYMKQLSVIRILAHLRYFQAQMEIIKMTKHPEEGVIKVRWRIRCMKHFKTVFKFFKNKVWQAQKNQRDHEVWYDGFSTYYINEKGTIGKHVVDKVMPDDTYEVTKKTPLASKLALLMGIVSIDNFSSKQYPFK